MDGKKPKSKIKIWNPITKCDLNEGCHEKLDIVRRWSWIAIYISLALVFIGVLVTMVVIPNLYANETQAMLMIPLFVILGICVIIIVLAIITQVITIKKHNKKHIEKNNG